MKVFINGLFYDRSEAKISVFDHGFLYGDGVFEGIRSYNCLIFKLEAHIERLFNSAKSINLKIPVSRKEIISAVIQTLQVNELRDAYIRLIITRGEGDLGLDPRKCSGKPGLIVITDKIALYPEKLYREGMKIITVPTVRNLPEALNPQIKSLNYLNNILAKMEAVNCGFEEAIMLDSLGYVAECTGDNIFIVKGGKVYTPPQCMGTLRGITRDAILDIAKTQKVPTNEHVITRHEVYISDECFLTGTAAEIIPIIEVDGRVIGDGKPGKFTKMFLRKFHAYTKTHGTRYIL